MIVFGDVSLPSDGHASRPGVYRTICLEVWVGWLVGWLGRDESYQVDVEH